MGVCLFFVLVLVSGSPFALIYVLVLVSCSLSVLILLLLLNSCSFIATQDLGKKYENKTFEVLGRFDNSDIRGCNLMVAF